MHTTLLILALSVSSAGCHRGGGGGHACHGGAHRQVAYSGCYGGHYGGGWAQPASYAPPMYQGGGTMVAPSGQMMGAVPSPTYAPTGTVASAPATYAAPNTAASAPVTTYAPTGTVTSAPATTYAPMGVSNATPNYGYNAPGSVPTYATPAPNGYMTGSGRQGWSPYGTGYGNYPGRPIPGRGMYAPNTPYTYSSGYGNVPLNGQSSGYLSRGMGAFPRLPLLQRGGR